MKPEQIPRLKKIVSTLKYISGHMHEASTAEGALNTKGHPLLPKALAGLYIEEDRADSVVENKIYNV